MHNSTEHPTFASNGNDIFLIEIFCFVQDEDDEDGDTFSIDIKVTDPVKRGDGMSAFMAYRINTTVRKTKQKLQNGLVFTS